MQEITRLAHVAVTRAKDRLYITGHRYLEGNCDASNIGRLMQQITSVQTLKTSRPASIALPDDLAVMTRQVHDGGEIELVLARYSHPLLLSGAGHCEIQ